MEQAIEELKAAEVAGRVVVSDAQKLQLYALFKQATIGDCCVPAPSVFRAVERAKWSSWYELVGILPSDAQRRYVELVQTLMPHGHERGWAARATVQEQTVVEPPGKAAGRRPQLHLVAQLVAMAGVMLFVAVKVVLPLGRYVAVDNNSDEATQYKELRHTLSSLLWFVVGYCLVLLLRSKIFPWPAGLSTVAPQAQSRHTRRLRRRAPVESELVAFLRRHRINAIHLTQPKDGDTAVPCLELTLPDDPDAFQFGEYNGTIPYAVEQTADVYYRKYKEPLPDPASPLLDSIKVLEERHLDKFCAVFKRRLLRFRNEAPSLIKPFASSDYIEYIEDSLLDKQNRIFYVYVKNESYQSLGVLEDFSVYKAHSDKPQWTDLHQFCRVHITSSSLFFVRSSIESFISSYYCKNAPDARRYHLQRIEEEFGDPVEY